MNKNYIIVGVVVLVGVLLVGWFAYSQSGIVMDDGSKMEGESSIEGDAMDKPGDAGDAMDKPDDAMEGSGAMMQKGSYEAYTAEKLALADKGNRILFFRASWCPTCRALDADIRENLGSIPENVTILDVNYDTETALKQKYGVTYQHTLVQVDAQGNQIAKWTGSPTLASLLAQVK